MRILNFFVAAMFGLLFILTGSGFDFAWCLWFSGMGADIIGVVDEQD